MTIEQLAELLDQTLDVTAWQDTSHNGLQVTATGPVRSVCCGVDAGMDFFQAAANAQANFLICHHGISWGDSLSRITDLNYNRIKFLLDHNMALYACHLPLDAHPRLGNNIQICRALKLQKIKKFGYYRGAQIGFAGQLPRAISYARLKQTIAQLLQTELRTMDCGAKTVRTIGVVSGGAADMVAEAGRAGFDAFLSGEPQLTAWHYAREYGINAIFGGHYATETFGVRAVNNWLRQHLKLPTQFIDLAVPY